MAVALIGCAGVYAAISWLFCTGESVTHGTTAALSETIPMNDTSLLTEQDELQMQMEAFDRDLSLSEIEAGKS